MLYVNFATGDLAEPGLTVLQVLHAVSMVLAWAVILPAGVWAAMFGRRKEPRGGPHAWWFVRHRALNYAALVVMACGAVSSYNMVDGVHLATTHSWLGLALLIVALLQPMAATCRPGKGERFRVAWEWIHKGSGRLSCLVCVPTVILGMTQMELGVGWVIAYALFTAAAVGVTAAWYVCGC